MKVSPLKKYRQPSYPTREEFLKDVSHIKNCVPDGWKNKKILTSALAVFLFGTSTNGSNKNLDKEAPVVFSELKGNSETGAEEQIMKKEEPPAIAPLFIHGGGRGAYGCVVINPPSFLSEQEAREIIESELKKEGIIFDKKNYKIDELAFKRDYGFDRDFEDFDDEEFLSSIRHDDVDTVVIDGYSTKYNLGYEFVSAWEDYHKFGGKYDGSSVTSFDVIKASENLREKMKQYGKMNTVIFYDPIEGSERTESKNPSFDDLKRYTLNDEMKCNIDIQQNEATMKQKSYELLKQQVADFIEWVKKEKLIENK